MNTHQALLRVRNILRGIRWNGTGDPVFAADSVFVSQGPAEDVIDQVGLPAAWVSAGSSHHDDEQPGLYDSDIHVVVLVSVPGDPYGEGVLMGRNQGLISEGEGRGLHEVGGEMLKNLKHLDAASQFRIVFRAASSELSTPVGSTGFHATRRYTFRTLLTLEEQHRQPLAVTAVESGGDVTITWTAPYDVTNLTGYVVRRMDGGAPAYLPTQGTDVPWTSGVSVTDSGAPSGVQNYSVFAAYDDEGGSLEFDFSDYDSAVVEVP